MMTLVYILAGIGVVTVMLIFFMLILGAFLIREAKAREAKLFDMNPDDDDAP